MQTLFRDIRYAFRMLFAHPAVTAVAVLALALGTGANSAIFSVVYAVLLRPLPVENVDRLVSIALVSEKLRVTGAQPNVNFYADAERTTSSYESVAAAVTGTATLGNGDTTIRFWRVSASFLPAMGVRPVVGRNFLKEEDQPGSPKVALVSYDFWRGRLNSGAPGASVVVNGEPYTVVGVVPRGFHVDGRPADVYSSLGARQSAREYLPANIYARLKPGVTLAQAQGELDALSRNRPPSPLGWRQRVWMMRDFQVRNVRLSLWVLLGAVGLVLLISCANTATLLLARAGARRKEIATRAALGAEKGRLLRQLLTESGVLSVTGGLCGLLVAAAAVRAVPLLAHERLPGLLEQVSVDGTVLAFTMAVSIATGFLFGAVPAVAILRGDLFGTLREGGQSLSPGRRRAWNALVVAETALALMLAIGASLLIHTFFYLRDVAPGFRTDNLLAVQVTPPRSTFTSPLQCNAYWKNVLEHLRTIPGVEAASFSTVLPLTGDNRVGIWLPEGVQIADPRELPPMWNYVVEEGYFRTMRIPLLAGRVFTARDDAAATKVALVNQTFVRRFWPGLNPVGKHLGGGPKEPSFEVIGVVGDVSAEETTKSAPPEVYFHFLQMPAARITAALRADPDVYGTPMALEPAVRRAIAAADPAAPPLQMSEMRRVISDRIAPQRLSAQLIAIFAGLALVLAAVGIYGVLSVGVAQRRHEIGVRIALGAEPHRVLGLIVGEAVLMAGCGIALGAGGALGLTRVMKSLLFGVNAGDPLTYILNSAALLAVAVLASVVPAIRATRIDPIACLRHE